LVGFIGTTEVVPFYKARRRLSSRKLRSCAHLQGVRFLTFNEFLETDGHYGAAGSGENLKQVVAEQQFAKK